LPDGAIRVEHVWKKFRADRMASLFYDQMARMRRSMSKEARSNYRGTSAWRSSPGWLLEADIAGPDGGPVLSLEDAHVRLMLHAPESFEADFFVGISPGTAFSIRHQAPRSLSVP
jgi:hypothetical protein